MIRVCSRHYHRHCFFLQYSKVSNTFCYMWPESPQVDIPTVDLPTYPVNSPSKSYATVHRTPVYYDCLPTNYALNWYHTHIESDYTHHCWRCNSPRDWDTWGMNWIWVSVSTFECHRRRYRSDSSLIVRGRCFVLMLTLWPSCQHSPLEFVINSIEIMFMREAHNCNRGREIRVVRMQPYHIFRGPNCLVIHALGRLASITHQDCVLN